jgi:serine/threonine-protein kinase SRPK3
MFTVVGDMSCDVSLQPPECSPVEWLEGIEVDDTAPRYLMTSQRLRGALGDVDFSTLLVKIDDMGGGNVAFRLHRHSRLYYRQVLTLYNSYVECTT